jgi:carboxymethylenebutenolidase
MGETIEFASNGDTARGYLATPASTPAPGLLVLQEWWGLNPQIKGVADRLAGEGFVALAPDLYRGELAEHTEMDKAAQLMGALPMDRAARDMSGAIDYLLSLPTVKGDAVGAIGFCMGGMLTLVVAAQHGDRIGAAAPYYGAPLGDSAPDWSNLSAPLLGHFAEQDDFFPPGAVLELQGTLRDLGNEVTFEIIPDTGHAFCNETDALGTYDAAATEKTWAHTMEFLHTHLG